MALQTVNAVRATVTTMIVLRYAVIRSSQIARSTARPTAAGASAARRRSSRARAAGKSVTIDRNAMKMAVPATKPNSRMPWKSVRISTKNAPVAVSAPSSMPGPARSAVRRRASVGVDP